MSIFEKSNVAANAEHGTIINVGAGSTFIRYLTGPRRVRVEWTDNFGNTESILMSPFDQHSMEPGRTFKQVQVFNLEPIDGRVEFQIGTGNFRPFSGPGAFGGSEAPRSATFNGLFPASAGLYGMIGISNPVLSRYVAEVVRIEVFPADTTPYEITVVSTHSFAEPPVPIVGPGGTLSPFFSAPVRLHDYSAGLTEVEATACSASTTAQNVFGVANINKIYAALAGGANSANAILDFESDPIIIRPGQMLLIHPSVFNKINQSTIRWRERRSS